MKKIFKTVSLYLVICVFSVFSYYWMADFLLSSPFRGSDFFQQLRSYQGGENIKWLAPRKFISFVAVFMYSAILFLPTWTVLNILRIRSKVLMYILFLLPVPTSVVVGALALAASV